MLRRTIFDADHDAFRAMVRDFIYTEIVPKHAEWEKSGIVDRGLFLKAGTQGVIGFNVEEAYGGGGADDFRFNAIVAEELAYSGAHGPGFTLHNDILAPYLTSLATLEQKQRWLPGFARGEIIVAVAMSEPGAGSDLAGIRTSGVRDDSRGGWVVNGAKTFISSGINADLVVVVARTDPEAGHKGFSLLVVERGMEGFERGRNLDKLGLHAQDTAELSFVDVFVPEANVLGEVGRGFYHLMHNLPSERLSIAINAVAAARAAFDTTLEYAKSRQAFGQPIGSFQNSRFVLAEIDTELEIAQAYVDRCIEAVLTGELTAAQSAKAKWWTTELQKKIVDQCLQLHGGYGYMTEYPISRMYADARIQTIYGGTTEIMKDIIGRDLGL